MKKVILLLTVLAVIAIGWFLYFHKGEKTTNVSLHEVTRGNLENTLEFSGEVVCTNIYSVMSETGGTIARLYVAEGNRVQAGDTLFDLDAAAIEAELEAAKLRYEVLSEAGTQTVMAQQDAYGASLQRQKAALALALSQTTGYDFESFNEALGGDVGAQAAAAAAAMGDSLSDLGKMDPATFSDAFSETNSELKLAALAVRQLEDALDKMSYKSRISGTVLNVGFHKGEVLAPGVPAMVIADTGSIAITGYVYEKDVENLKMNMDVNIVTEQGSYTGTLTGIGKAAADIGVAAAFDTMTKVQITPDSAFRKMPGAVVDLKIVISAKSGVLTLPIDCLTEDGCVFVVGEDNIVEKRAVVTGFEDMFNVEIVRGLSEGEMVVTSPRTIEEGEHVSYDRG